ncbi:reverse transcriptase N-terminal domain-containing protein [Lentzea sp. NBRC 105346]|uniref:reverse transcriptase N-terminal domain-containing protein n=1 Tax=Lentzea sp. NBRC 105346 TaxID=3032205 RepID=UPI0025568ACA|nr:reverse transcriptase N-terminal domain-containing protein [Lentzea sp. NBRC 105346]
MVEVPVAGRNGNDGKSSVDCLIGGWSSIPWRKLETAVYRLQKRIFRASCRGDVAVVRSVQRLLMKSEAARCLAVRRVTQDNQGKHTAGIDGVASVSLQ